MKIAKSSFYFYGGIIMLKGYCLKPNFFTNEPQSKEVTFYLTDGGRTGGNIMRIKEVFVSIDMDNKKGFLVIPEAYSESPFFASYNLGEPTGINSLHKVFHEIHEWLGYVEEWRKVGRTYKTCTIITIEDGETEIEIQQGESQ